MSAESYIDWQLVHEIEIFNDPESQYDVFDVMHEQHVFRALGAPERDIQAHGRLMMKVVERMAGYTDDYIYLGETDL